MSGLRSDGDDSRCCRSRLPGRKRFGLANRQMPVDNVPHRRFWFGVGQKGAGMAGGNDPGPQCFLHCIGQVQQAQRVADVAAGLADSLTDSVLGQAELVDEALIALGLVDRVEILALQVLDQCDGGGIRVRQFADEGWHLVQSPRRRRPASGARRR